MDNKKEIETIIHKIMLRHIGSANAITSAKIAQIIGNYYEDSTHQGTRESIRECLESSCIPIGSNTKGYFLISNDDEYRAYLDNLECRIMGIKKRARLVKEAWENVKADRGLYRLHQVCIDEVCEL